MRPTDEEIRARAHALNQHLGPVVGPIQAAQRGMELIRRNGRTTEMVKALPDDGRAIVLVLKPEHWRDHVRQQVLIHRGPDYPIDMLRVMTTEDIMRGKHHQYPYPVFVENDVTDKLAVDFVAGLQPKGQKE